MRTTGEIEFQKFCYTHGITCSALPAGPGKTPDFELVREGMTVVAEVKDFKDRQAYMPPQPNSVRIVPHNIGGAFLVPSETLTSNSSVGRNQESLLCTMNL